MELIPQLKQEHERIARSLNLISGEIESGITPDSELLNDIEELNTMLESHMDVENKLLYAVFEKSKIKELREISQKFSKDMIRVYDNFLAFLGKYSREDISRLQKSPVFRKDFEEVRQAVLYRVKVEETILFPLYAKNFEK